MWFCHGYIYHVLVPHCIRHHTAHVTCSRHALTRYITSDSDPLTVHAITVNRTRHFRLHSKSCFDTFTLVFSISPFLFILLIASLSSNFVSKVFLYLLQKKWPPACENTFFLCTYLGWFSL